MSNHPAVIPVGFHEDEIQPAVVDRDSSHPRAVINLLPKFMRDRVHQLPPSTLHLRENELNELLFTDGKGRPTRRKNVGLVVLRLQFWDEYDRVVRHKLPGMDFNRVLDRVMSPSLFQEFIAANSEALMYILTPPVPYLMTLRECMLLGVERFKEILAIPAVDADGQPNLELAEIQLKMFQTLDLRLHGAATQRIQVDQKTLNVNVDGNDKKGEPKSLEEIQARIAALEAQRREALPPRPAIHVDLMREVTPVPAEVPNGRKAPSAPPAEEVATDAEFHEAP
jgi:hypothetical protein